MPVDADVALRLKGGDASIRRDGLRLAEFGRRPQVDVLETNVNILNGNAPDLDAECRAYEQRIADAGGIRLFLAGIGPDGHIAFNEPGSVW